MAFQLQEYLRSTNGTVSVAGRTFSVGQIHEDGFADLGEKGKEYVAIWNEGLKIIGKPNAEVWTVQTIKGTLIGTVGLDANAQRFEVAH